MTLSFQLYSARNFTPWDSVFTRLAELGYTQVEGFGANYEDAGATRAALDAAGLSMPSAHFGIGDLETRFDWAMDTARTLGVTRLFAPYLDASERPGTADGWRAFAQRLAEMGARVSEAGLRFGWHNHDFEFTPLEGGTIPMQVILDEAPQIDWEADIAWILRGGQDPRDWISRFGPRITAAHVKDIAPQGENAGEDGWADVGHGVMDWPSLAADLRAADVSLFVLEHDNPNDFNRFASRSIEAFRAF
ncbi:sugar phosphate isomerase/epimerase family protein [Poseidonocella sedimentorum]|uniref:Sugar phosphate isomerase/epimerase n=1 Tax=Poseidonocella sedimentorum TaxID=871652 RepID=A0A1I6CX29_9RHOB|nr:sugar phosphate isomerase/epimerase [Poseidonocella sedimentorum]SFQ97710.1 Sugar phosphate isomerase/epimerase [Poseidonocella sedimentorum]